MSLCGYVDFSYQLIQYGACLCGILYFLMWLYGNITLPYVKIFLFLLLQQLFCVHMWLYGHMLISYAQKRLNRIIFHDNTNGALLEIFTQKKECRKREPVKLHIFCRIKNSYYLENKKAIIS